MNPPLQGRALANAISGAISDLYHDVYGHDRTPATTYINDNMVLCVLDNILTTSESQLVQFGSGEQVLDGRVAFQGVTEDQFTVATETLTRQHVVAFPSANQTTPSIACELFLLDGDPRAAALRGVS